MKYDRNEAIRYFNAPSTDKLAGQIVDLAYLKLRNSIRAKSVWRIFDCLLTNNEVILPACNIKFQSKQLVDLIKDCTQVVVFAATLGSEVDIALRRLAINDIAQSAAAQAVCAALIESYCDEIEEEILLGLNGKYLLPRFSPGYSGWKLEDQRMILKILECDKKIGLTLTDGFMLAPVKSVTAIIGISEKKNMHQDKCKICENKNCQIRKG